MYVVASIQGGNNIELGFHVTNSKLQQGRCSDNVLSVQIQTITVALRKEKSMCLMARDMTSLIVHFRINKE